MMGTVMWGSSLKDFNRFTPLRIALLYALTGGGWILFTDYVLGFIVADRQLLFRLKMATGWLFIGATAVFLYFLIQWGNNELRKSQKELQEDKENLERYRLLSEDTLDLILFIRPDGQIMDANEVAVKRYGYTRQELTNMPLHKLRLPQDKSSVQHFLQKAPQGIQFELQHVCKDGSVFPVDVTAKGATSNGKPIIVSIIRDITNRKNEEALVWLEKERAQVTLESIGDAVITTDVGAIVEYLNPVAEALTGWTMAEAVGLSLESVFHTVNEESPEMVENPIILCLQEECVVEFANHTILMDRKGSSLAIEFSAAPIRDRNDVVIGVVLVFRDVSYKRSLLKELAHQAQHDALTGLPNRHWFNKSLSQALIQSRSKTGMLAVMFLDLDRFKLINDTMGHNLGDQLLKKVAERVGQTLRTGDILARLGGDEFLILLSDIRNDQEVVSVSERILKVFTQPIVIEDNEVYMSTSIGISLYPRDGSDMETLVKQADTAMYLAKEKGRNNYQFFTYDLNIKANERLTTEYSLRKALAREEFVLHYQPQVDFESGCVVGLEALVRWNSKERGIISPTAFIPIAEETGLIVPIGEWVLRAACLQNVAWKLQGYSPMRMAVNISARQFRERNFIQVVEGILKETGMEAHLLELEITESIAMENGEASSDMLRGFKELGVRISIDDFGTGFSSLNYLRRMPIDTLKIDQSFIQDISTGEDGEELVTAIIQLAKNLRLKVIAEGVETDTQWSFLKDKECNEMQGFLFSKAVTSKEVEMLFVQPIEVN